MSFSMSALAWISRKKLKSVLKFVSRNPGLISSLDPYQTDITASGLYKGRH